jgi:hypothetical protein
MRWHSQNDEMVYVKVLVTHFISKNLLSFTFTLTLIIQLI